MRWTLVLLLTTLALTALPVHLRRGEGAVAVPASGAISRAACTQPMLAGRCLSPPRCADGEIDLDGLCVPAQTEAPLDPAGNMVTSSHVDRTGRLVVYEHIPLRPDLPADYEHYRYPVPPWRGRTVTSGYDLGYPDAFQRRGPEFSAVGHGGVDLPRERGTPVTVLTLRGQVGDAEV